MKKLTTFLKECEVEKVGVNEAFKISSVGQVDKLVASYLSKHLNSKVMRMPGLENYANSQSAGFGIRFFIDPGMKGIDSVRFNWQQKKVDTASVVSVDLFGGGKHKHNLSFEYGTSMVKVLPFIIDFIDKPERPGYTKFVNESMLTEAGESLFVQFAKKLEELGELPATKGKMYKLFKQYFKDEKPTTSNKIFDAVAELSPQSVVKAGKREKLDFDEKTARKLEGKLGEEIYTEVKVNKGSSGEESYTEEPEVEAIIAPGLEKLNFEQQLEDMEESVRMLYIGVTNAVFIGGRGGIGKTHNVEKVLSEIGLSDGEGYFKNAGSISASGLYRLLYRHRDDLIVFDDSDSVFGDQEARNILKGATDTKPVRKLAWSKKSSDIIHPDDFTDDDEEEGKVPSYFDFKGKILFISNLKMDKLDPDGALRTRGLMIEINPTDEEVYNFMRKIAPDIPLPDGLTLTDSEIREVVDVLEQKSSRKPNLRTLVRALKIRAGTRPGFDWENFVVRYA